MYRDSELKIIREQLKLRRSLKVRFYKISVE